MTEYTCSKCGNNLDMYKVWKDPNGSVKGYCPKCGLVEVIEK